MSSIAGIDFEVWNGQLHRLRPRVAEAKRDGTVGTLSHTYGTRDRVARPSTVQLTTWATTIEAREQVITELDALIGTRVAVVDGNDISVPSVLIKELYIVERKTETNPFIAGSTPAPYRLTLELVMQEQPVAVENE